MNKTEDSNMKTMNIELVCVSTSEIKKTLKGMSRGKAGGAQGLSIDLIKIAGEFLLYTLTMLFTKCLQTSSIQSAYNFVLIIIIHKKGDIKNLKNRSAVCSIQAIYKSTTHD